MRKLYDKLMTLVEKVGADKFLHCLLCLIFASFVATSILKFSTIVIAVVLTIILTNVLIIGKETYDKNDYGLFSIADVIWGEVGMILGILLSLY